METIGKIERIRKDRKGVSLGFDNWYNSKNIIPEMFKVGNNVKIVFIPNKIEDKVFNNIKIIEILPTDSETKQIKSIIIPNQTMNTALLCTKDIIVAIFNKGHYYTENEMTSLVKKLTKDFIDAYKENL